MTKSGPGLGFRKGISTMQIVEMFPDEHSARSWFENLRWPDGDRICPRCDSDQTSETKTGKPMPYWCRPCRKYFSVKVGTIMESSKLPLRTWVMALFLMSTNLKGVSSMKLHRDLGITQKTAWFMAQKIRVCWATDGLTLSGEVEVDETYVGGRSHNMHANKRPKGSGPANKAAVIGAKQRNGRVVARPLQNLGKRAMVKFLDETVKPGATVYTDSHRGYYNMKGFKHTALNHSVGQYVDGVAHTNGIESFWAMLKRGYIGTYHKMSVKHLSRYVNEFAGRANVRHHDTLLVQMVILAGGMVGKRLPWKELTA